MPYTEKNGKIFVDTDFIQASARAWPGADLRHMGFGEFELVTPQGAIQFDQMRGQDFPGQKGRSHQMYDDRGGDKASRKLLEMVKAKRASRKSLRANCIKLASARPHLRPFLVPLILKYSNAAFRPPTWMAAAVNRGELPVEALSVWKYVAEKQGSHFSYPGAVAYWRNKARKEKIDIGKFAKGGGGSGSTKDFPIKGGDQIEEWVREKLKSERLISQVGPAAIETSMEINSIQRQIDETQETINKHIAKIAVGDRANRRQIWLGKAQVKLEGLQKGLKQAQRGVVEVKAATDRYPTHKMTTIAFEKKFQALLKEARADLTKNQLLTAALQQITAFQAQVENDDSMAVTASAGDWLKGRWDNLVKFFKGIVDWAKGLLNVGAKLSDMMDEAQIIRLAAQRPDLRPYLLPLVASSPLGPQAQAILQRMLQDRVKDHTVSPFTPAIKDLERSGMIELMGRRTGNKMEARLTPKGERAAKRLNRRASEGPRLTMYESTPSYYYDEDQAREVTGKLVQRRQATGYQHNPRHDDHPNSVANRPYQQVDRWRMEVGSEDLRRAVKSMWEGAKGLAGKMGRDSKVYYDQGGSIKGGIVTLGDLLSQAVGLQSDIASFDKDVKNMDRTWLNWLYTSGPSRLKNLRSAYRDVEGMRKKLRLIRLESGAVLKSLGGEDRDSFVFRSPVREFDEEYSGSQVYLEASREGKRFLKSLAEVQKEAARQRMLLEHLQKEMKGAMSFAKGIDRMAFPVNS